MLAQRNGYYTEDSAKIVIEKKLMNLPSFELKFRNEACTKCGVYGDSRYVIAPCHTKSEYMHTKPASLKHTGPQIFEHTLELTDIKTLTEQKKHTGYRRCNHSGAATDEYHPGQLKKAVARVTAAIFTFSTSEWIW